MSLSVVHRNEVLLVGRVETAPVERVLPGGDQVLSWRLSVQRPADPERRTIPVDSVDCMVGSGALARRAGSWAMGDIVEINGALRRRFWRGAGGVQSRCEVEVQRARRLARAAAPVHPVETRVPEEQRSPADRYSPADQSSSA